MSRKAFSLNGELEDGIKIAKKIAKYAKHQQLATNTMAQDLKYIYLYLSSNAQASSTQQRTSENFH